jgi:hypothetical protein
VIEHQILQEDLNTLEDWSNKWQLKFNSTKCKVMYVGGQPKEDYFMKLEDGTKIKLIVCETEKDLGITFDNRLHFKDHISSAIKKANQLVGMIRRSFTHLDEDSFKLLFKSIARPVIEYGNIVWCPYLRNLIVQVENVQRRATKLVPGLGKLSYRERLERLKLPTLEYRRWRGTMLETYKFLQGIYDVNPESVGLILDDKSRTRGHNYKLYKHKFHLNTRKNSYGLRVVNEWNNLPEEVVNAASINSFKNKLDSHWSTRKYDINYIWNRTIS